MIDDGSTDGSKDICQEYASADSRFRLICSSHAGCAESRNLGLRESTGHYITFVDSDDYVTTTYLSDLYRSMMASDGVDMVAQGLTRVVGSKKEVRGNFCNERFNLTSQTDLFFCRFSLVTSGSVCAKLFRADLIKTFNLEFHPEVKLAEDMGFVIEYLSNSSIVMLDSNLDYFYEGNPVSTSTCYWDFSLEEQGYRILTSLWQVLLKKYPSKELEPDYSVFVGNYINRMIYSNIIHPYPLQNKKENFRHLKNSYYPDFAALHHPKTMFTKLLKFTSLHEYYTIYSFLMKLAIWRYNLPVNCK